jgi:hypothetical protein
MAAEICFLEKQGPCDFAYPSMYRNCHQLHGNFHEHQHPFVQLFMIPLNAITYHICENHKLFTSFLSTAEHIIHKVPLLQNAVDEIYCLHKLQLYFFHYTVCKSIENEYSLFNRKHFSHTLTTHLGLLTPEFSEYDRHVKCVQDSQHFIFLQSAAQSTHL